MRKIILIVACIMLFTFSNFIFAEDTDVTAPEQQTMNDVSNNFTDEQTAYIQEAIYEVLKKLYSMDEFIFTDVTKYVAVDIDYVTPPIDKDLIIGYAKQESVDLDIVNPAIDRDIILTSLKQFCKDKGYELIIDTYEGFVDKGYISVVGLHYLKGDGGAWFGLQYAMINGDRIYIYCCSLGYVAITCTLYKADGEWVIEVHSAAIA